MDSEKKLMIPESKIPECPEHKAKSKIRNMFVNKKITEEYSVKIYKTDLYFCEHRKEKIQVDKNVGKYILFRTDVYFTEYLLAVEIDERKHVDRDLIFEEKRQNGQKFIRINVSKEGYEADYEASRIQTFISKFKDRQLKQLNKH